ncbi:glycosyltransferase family 2 protein [Aeromonas allosaccharophila]|uniref:glycosyltransferase family 2 protein n=1 Tax=Aeromonas allosaccharophila TaxID=656 RepID=UPI0030077417
MKVSVIIPVYNVSRFIEMSLNSIINQNYYGFDVEVIVVDDASTDGTYNASLDLARSNKNIKVYKNVKNSKICKTLNQALIYAEGDYILRIDGDDIALPNRFSTQLNYLQQHNLDLVGCQMISIDEDGNELSKGNMPVGVDKVRAACQFASPIAHIWLAKREVYEALGGYREIPYAEDYDFILRALDKGFRCDNTPEHLMLIRQRAGNTASTASLKQRKTHKYVLELHKRRMNHKNDDDGFSEAELAKRISSWPLTEKLHVISTQLMTSAYHEKNALSKAVKILSACLLSYYNFEYLVSRVRFKKSFM